MGGGTEVWHWGDLFELDVPLDAEVHDLGEMIELRFSHVPDNPLLVAAFSDEPHGPERAVRSALDRFAQTRGLSPGTGRPVVSVDPRGVVLGRLAFVADLAWEVLALAWQRQLVVAFSAASVADDPVFVAARELIATLRPSELIGTSELPPEARGDF
jgi:hypothetical protein